MMTFFAGIFSIHQQWQMTNELRKKRSWQKCDIVMCNGISMQQQQRWLHYIIINKFFWIENRASDNGRNEDEEFNSLNINHIYLSTKFDDQNIDFIRLDALISSKLFVAIEFSPNKRQINDLKHKTCFPRMNANISRKKCHRLQWNKWKKEKECVPFFLVWPSRHSAQLNIKSEEILSSNYRINGWQTLCNIQMGVYNHHKMTKAHTKKKKTRIILFSHVCGQLVNMNSKISKETRKKSNKICDFTILSIEFAISKNHK